MIQVNGSIKGIARLEAAVERLGGLMRGGIPEAARQAARGFVRRVVAVTPPASEGATGLDARRQGERKIDRQLAGVFVPVRLQHKRREENPDVQGLYDQYVKPGKGRRGKIVSLGHKFWVDQNKFNALRETLVGNVGFLAGGWNAGAQELGVPIPAWIARHGTVGGSCQVEVTETSIRIVITNGVVYDKDAGGNLRRTKAALNFQADAFERELEFLLERSVTEVGLR